VLSVLTQTYPYFELIIIDDGSTDSSVYEINTFTDGRIRTIRQSNYGVSAARNSGIKNATHSLVAFLDADDEWKPDFLETILVLVNQFPNCGLYGTSYETQAGEISWRTKGLFPAGWSGIIPDFLKIMSLHPLCSSAVVARAEIMEKVGGFPVGVKNGEDVATWLRCSLISPIAYAHQPLVIYYRGEENSTSIGFDWRQEFYPCKVLMELIRDNSIAGESRVFALDFIAGADFKAAKACFRAGEPFKGVIFLLKCLPSASYRRRIIPLMQGEFLPSLKKVLVGGIK